MNPLGDRILEVLQASSYGYSTAFSVFNVLNRDGFTVTKHEFEQACKKLHDGACITYRPVECSLIDIPIGTLELLTKSAVLAPFSESADLALGIGTLSERSAAEASTIEVTRGPVESETPPNREGLIGKSSVVQRPAWTSVFAVPILLVQAWQRARASSWFGGFFVSFLKMRKHEVASGAPLGVGDQV
jgi:hypothetical protein